MIHVVILQSTTNYYALRTSATALLLLAGMTCAHAQFSIVGETHPRDSDQAQYVLDYDLSASRSTTRVAERGIVPPGEISGSDVPARRVSTDPLIRTCLIALPSEAETFSATFGAKGAASTSAIAGSAVTIEKVYAGTFPALKVSVNEALADATIQSLRISVSARLSSEKVPTASLSQYADARQIASSIFLNGASLDDAPLANKMSMRGLPTAPAPFRVEYHDGNEILRVPATSVGNPASAKFTHHGTTVSLGGTLGSDFWFYAPRRNTLTDLSDSVFVDPAATSPSMSSRPAFPTLSASLAEVSLSRTKDFDLPLEYQQSTNLPVGTRFVYWRLGANSTRTQSLQLDDFVTSPSVDYFFRMVGYNQTTTANPDHFATMSLDGTALPNQQWEGRTVHTFSGTATIPAIGVSSITVSHTIPAATFIDLQFLDDVSLTYTAFPRVSSKKIAHVSLPSAGSPRRVTIGGFPIGTTASDVMVLDVTTSSQPQILQNPATFTDVSGTVAIEFEAPSIACEFVAELTSAIVSVTALPTEQLPALPLPGETLGGVYVSPPAFVSTLQPLAALQPNRILMLDPQSAYNVYNGGQQSPQAIFLALADLLQNSPMRTPFPFVLLAAHGSLDPRNYLNAQSGAQIPPFVEEGVLTSGLTIENPIDYPYATIIGGDEFEDVQLGRIPAKTVTDLARAVNRSIAYDALAPTFLTDLTRPGIFISDDQDGAEIDDFISDSPTLVSRWLATDHPATAIDVSTSSNGSTERAAIRAAFTNSPGAAFALYTGHGNTTLWASESIWNIAEMATLANVNRWPPLVATFTCLNGRFCMPNASSNSLAEAWLFAGDGGSVTNIAPGGVDYYSEQRLFSLAAMDQAGNPTLRPTTVGELMLRARTNFLLNHGSYALTAREYLLFGDPATKMALPDPPPPIEDEGVSEWILY